MSFRRCLLILPAILVGFMPLAGMAQSINLPNEVVTSDKPLNSDQQQAIENAVTQLAARLLRGTDAQVCEARARLLELFYTPGATDIYKKALSLEINRRLQGSLDSDRMVVRLNAMIVVAELFDIGAVDLIISGLHDSNPAVRYWAGRSISGLVSRLQLPTADRKRILQGLNEAIATEQAEQVIRTLLVGMVDLNIPESLQQAVAVIERRVPLHAANPNLPINAEFEGMQKLFRNIVTSDAAGGAPQPATIRNITVVCIRYMGLAASLLDSGRCEGEAAGQWKKMIELSDIVLRWTTPKLGANAKALPGVIDQPLVRENWAEILLRIEDWKSLLRADPIKMQPAELVATVPS